MNKNSFLMLILGLAVGVLIGYAAFNSAKPEPEFNIEAEGLRNVSFADGRFTIELVRRIDSDTVEIAKNIQMPTAGFLKGYSAMEQLVNKLVDEDVLKRGGDTPE